MQYGALIYGAAWHRSPLTWAIFVTRVGVSTCVNLSTGYCGFSPPLRHATEFRLARWSVLFCPVLQESRPLSTAPKHAAGFRLARSGVRFSPVLRESRPLTTAPRHAAEFPESRLPIPKLAYAKSGALISICCKTQAHDQCQANTGAFREPLSKSRYGQFVLATIRR